MSLDSEAAGRRFSCADLDERRRGIDAAVAAVQRGELVVLPTDTVYGIGADAFEPAAVDAILRAKGRGRDMPPPVLVGRLTALDGVATDIPEAGRRLVEEFWPGALTVICREQPSLDWDLGDNRGTVAIRMPDDEVALELLRRTGPLAVSSANRSGEPPATTVDEAEEQLGDKVAVYLDGGSTPGPIPSSMVDLSRGVPCLLRAGALSLERLREVVPELVDVDELEELEAVAEAEVTVEAEGAETATEPAAGEAANAAETDEAATDTSGEGVPSGVGPGDGESVTHDDAGESEDTGGTNATAADEGEPPTDDPPGGSEDSSPADRDGSDKVSR